MRSAADAIRLFGMSTQMLERDLDATERTLSIDLGRSDLESPGHDEQYYPQFSESVRHDAAVMARHYEMFYCLEQSIRGLIVDKLSAAHGANWWDTKVPQQVKQNAEKNLQREVESGISQRSTNMLDYTTFGELGDIVRANWTDFADTLNNEKAFSRVMANLNLLRGPIAHCSPLAADEVVRLDLTLRDWFRLME